MVCQFSLQSCRHSRSLFPQPSVRGVLGDLIRPSHSKESVEAPIHPPLVAIPIPQAAIHHHMPPTNRWTN
ncbi:hypothetical protein GUJ93_ZPchr0011g28869 [Zizania palustris]|uniref:Uncharacterized protein n=1 Tax=Zizania palustris TaxID=103762 RepID=A0A8J5WLB3_ZIZPA|nr:hypothetical protein GUJ93_ZPchr0011g28869 [Zizania palustris]